MPALYLLALEPIAETTADRNSYGFRPERSTTDAREQCFICLAGRNCAQWVLEADIAGCFDAISHEWLIDDIPVDKAILQKWLKAGFVFQNQLFPTEAGTPQGGIISPVLDQLSWMRGLPEVITVDNGPEFAGKVLDSWAYRNRVKLDFSRPGKPVDNAFIESFNRIARDECLNDNWFLSLDHAKEIIEEWQYDYNNNRPHSALGGLTPVEFAAQFEKNFQLQVLQ